MRGDTLQTALSVSPRDPEGRLLFVRAEVPAENERSPPVGQRNVGDSIRRRDVGRRAAVHRTYGTEAASWHPSGANGLGAVGESPRMTVDGKRLKLILVAIDSRSDLLLRGSRNSSSQRRLLKNPLLP